MAHRRCRPFHHQLSGMWPTWAGHWRGGQGAVAMTHPWWPWRPCWQLADPGETCVPGGCCMVGTTIQRGLSLLGAGVCGGGWRPSPLGCTAALSTGSGCMMLPTTFMHWPGGDTEPLPCHLLSPCWERIRGSLPKTFMGSWKGLGLWGSAGSFLGVLEGSGGSVGLNCDLCRVLGQLRRVAGRAAGNFTGSWGAQEGP